MPCGLLRDGPRAERLSTVEYAAQQKKTAGNVAKDIAANHKDRTRIDHEIDLIKDIKANRSAEQDDLSRKQAEFDAGLEAMETLVTQLETGDATISDGSIKMQNPPKFLERLFSLKERETRTTSIFRRLLKLIVRGVDAHRSTREATSEPDI